METKSGRRGRLPASERAAREAAVLDAAEQEMLEHGYAHVTMLGIARRAGASKETLYSWFGNRDGLFAAMIARNADRAAGAVQRALDGGTPARETLVGFATGLLILLTSPASVALNHAAMQSPELAEQLLASGRYRVGPLVERYLAELDRAGQVRVADPEAAFTTLYGLIIRDDQIRVLLGEPAATGKQVRRRAETAVDQFLALHAPAG
ncbi:MAG: TetR/AcrR family transcriptional regulator [Ilumatobacter sp.]|nr:TetR/AcrR family transcriptional regulator [Ilumatobacter sp.]